MPLGRKAKIVSRLNALNKMVLDAEPDNSAFIAELIADPILVQFNTDMCVILGAIRAKAAKNSGNVNNIATPATVPIPKRRYMGELSFDTTSKDTSVIGEGGEPEIKYKYDHLSAFRINAQGFRDRLDNLLKLREQENDLLDLHVKPNPGMWLGYDKALAA